MTPLTAERVAELIIYSNEFANGTAIERDTVTALRELAAIKDAVAAAPESPEAVVEAVPCSIDCDGDVHDDGCAWMLTLDRICRRDARHEAEKQALRAERDEARACARTWTENAVRAGQLTTAAQADADALRTEKARLQSLVDSYGPTVDEHNAIEQRQEAEIDALRTLLGRCDRFFGEACDFGILDGKHEYSLWLATRAALGGKAAPPTAAQIDLAARALWTIGNARIGVREWGQVGHHYLFEAEAALLAARGLQWNGTPPAERIDGGKATGGEHG